MLHFVNVETPGLFLEQTGEKSKGYQTDAERVANFRYLADILKTLGFYCCGTDPKPSEAKIEDAMKAK